MILRSGNNKNLPMGLSLAHTRDLDWVKNSPIEFYLTGSWAFGTERRGSDIDFYTANRSFTAQELDKMGFTEIPLHAHGSYADPLLKRLFYNGNIHIQLVDPINMKHKIQSSFEDLPDHIKAWAFGHRLAKTEKRNIWQIALYLMGLNGGIDPDTATPMPRISTPAANPHTCKICGSPGIDMLFAFHCTNPMCSNYKP